jgi:hypothetical protein
VPRWLAERMARLGRLIAEAIAHHYGADELLRRLAQPFWFQSFGSVMGMDWHSSGITTAVLGALKRGLEPVSDELGLYVCGGRGRHARRTPAELRALGERTGWDAEGLVRTSRLVAKVDSAALQDGFQLYLHGLVATREGRWAVVQQGMNPDQRQARRYHWLSEGLRSFVDEPHQAIEGHPGGAIVNLTDRRAGRSRAEQLGWVARGPDAVLAALRRERAAPEPSPAAELPLPRLQLPSRHAVRAPDVVLRRLHAALRAAAEAGPCDYPELLLVQGVGARTLEALALVAEVIHGAPCRFSDPARFSLALGGKDGHPFPVPLRVYDETLEVLRRALQRARLGHDERLDALRRLDAQSRRIERAACGGPDFDTWVARQRELSPSLRGRAIGSPRARRRPRREPAEGPRQLALPGAIPGPSRRAGRSCAPASAGRPRSG